MGLKPDNWIKRMALEHRMIEPFEEAQVRDGVISFGTSSYGYDIRTVQFVRDPGDKQRNKSGDRQTVEKTFQVHGSRFKEA